MPFCDLLLSVSSSGLADISHLCPIHVQSMHQLFVTYQEISLCNNWKTLKKNAL